MKGTFVVEVPFEPSESAWGVECGLVYVYMYNVYTWRAYIHNVKSSNF